MRAGWRTAFAPEAVSITDLPTEFRVLWRQRTRWGRGGFRAYFAKHHRALRPSAVGWS